MEEMLLINPRRRAKRAKNGRFLKRKTNARRRRVSAGTRRRRRRNPIAAVALANPRRRRRRNPIAAIAAANPRRRRRRNPVGAYLKNSRRRRRNPRGMGGALGAFKPRAILNALIPAGIGAGGAIALDLALQYVPLPAQFQTPLWKNVARVVGAIGLGYAASFVIGREKAKAVTLGGLTVAAYGALRDVISTNFPSLGLSGIDPYGQDYSDLRMGYINPAAMLTGNPGNNMGAYLTPAPGVGAYMRGSIDNVNSLNGLRSTDDGM